MNIPGPHFEVALRGNPHSPPDTLSGCDEEIGRLLLRSAERLLAALEPRIAEISLNQARLQVLEVLRRHDETGCSQTQLADELLLSESNLSTLVDRMGDDGLVSRQRSESDRRKTVIRLTGAGARALDHAVGVRRESLRQIFGGLDLADKQQLTSLLQCVLERLEHQLVRQGRRRFAHGRGAAATGDSGREPPPRRVSIDLATS
jgi:DNA-binding MarR family transcriptional regulator